MSSINAIKTTQTSQKPVSTMAKAAGRRYSQRRNSNRPNPTTRNGMKGRF